MSSFVREEDNYSNKRVASVLEKMTTLSPVLESKLAVPSCAPGSHLFLSIIGAQDVG